MPKKVSFFFVLIQLRLYFLSFLVILVLNHFHIKWLWKDQMPVKRIKRIKVMENERVRSSFNSKPNFELFGKCYLQLMGFI